MIVANRYAKSLKELALEQNKLEAVRKDMQSIEKVCKEHDFALFLESPVIKTDKKVEVLKEVFKGNVSDLSLEFMILIAKKNRESILKNIAQAFEEQYRKDQNIYSAVITSARGLDNTTRQKVLDLIKSQLKGEVELIEKIDTSTIGGFVLKIGDKQIDKSVARQLSNLKKELTNKGLN